MAARHPRSGENPHRDAELEAARMDLATATADESQMTTTCRIDRRKAPTMTTTHSSEHPTLFDQVWKSSVLSGVIAVALGAAVLAWPGKTLLVAAFLFGAYLLLSYLAQNSFALGLHTSAGSRILLFISGAASLILAILAFRHFGREPGKALLLLAIWIGVGFIFRGVATTATAISELYGTPGRGVDHHPRHHHRPRRNRHPRISFRLAADPHPRRRSLADRPRCARDHRRPETAPHRTRGSQRRRPSPRHPLNHRLPQLPLAVAQGV